MGRVPNILARCPCIFSFLIIILQIWCCLCASNALRFMNTMNTNVVGYLLCHSFITLKIELLSLTFVFSAAGQLCSIIHMGHICIVVMLQKIPPFVYFLYIPDLLATSLVSTFRHRKNACIEAFSWYFHGWPVIFIPMLPIIEYLMCFESVFMYPKCCKCRIY